VANEDPGKDISVGASCLGVVAACISDELLHKIRTSVGGERCRFEPLDQGVCVRAPLVVGQVPPCDNRGDGDIKGTTGELSISNVR
jgi:hypothetical protein